jgi:hypothetical protein
MEAGGEVRPPAFAAACWLMFTDAQPQILD